MTTKSIKAVTPSSAAFDKLMQEIQDDISKIRQRSYELFAGSGFVDGGDFDNWLQAERELFDIPPAELAEDEKEYRVTVTTPGFGPDQLTIAVTADSLTIRGNARGSKKYNVDGKSFESGVSQKQIFRHFHLGSLIDPDRVKASFEGGMLSVSLPKAARASDVPVEAAAAKAA